MSSSVFDRAAVRALRIWANAPTPAKIETNRPKPEARIMRRLDIQDMARADAGEDDEEPSPQDGFEDNSALAPTEEQVECFRALYLEHFDFVFRNLRRLGVDPAQVDDALQEVFIVVLRQLPKYQPGSHAKAWLFAIALRVARNLLRSGRRRDKHITAAGLETSQLLGQKPGDPFEHVAAGEAATLLGSFLDELDDDKRAVFIMTELEQLSAPEIASALNLNLNTVYGRIRAARQQFNRLIEAAKTGQEPT